MIQVRAAPACAAKAVQKVEMAFRSRLVLVAPPLQERSPLMIVAAGGIDSAGPAFAVLLVPPAKSAPAGPAAPSASSVGHQSYRQNSSLQLACELSDVVEIQR